MKSFTYQNRRKKDYFEGWYTRLVDIENNINIAVIFALTKNELDPHAFIQVYDGVELTNKYFRFDIRLGLIHYGSHVASHKTKKTWK